LLGKPSNGTHRIIVGGDQVTAREEKTKEVSSVKWGSLIEVVSVFCFCHYSQTLKTSICTVNPGLWQVQWNLDITRTKGNGII